MLPLSLRNSGGYENNEISSVQFKLKATVRKLININLPNEHSVDMGRKHNIKKKRNEHGFQFANNKHSPMKLGNITKVKTNLEQLPASKPEQVESAKAVFLRMLPRAFTVKTDGSSSRNWRQTQDKNTEKQSKNILQTPPSSRTSSIEDRLVKSSSSIDARINKPKLPAFIRRNLSTESSSDNSLSNDTRNHTRENSQSPIVPKISCHPRVLTSPKKEGRFSKTGCCDSQNEKDSPESKKKKKKSSNIFLDEESRLIEQQLQMNVSPYRTYQVDAQTEFKKLSTSFYYDSHCHLDYIYNKFGDYDGCLEKWMDDYKSAFPSNFGGCLPNFIDPDLFVLGFNDEVYDMSWVKDELSNPHVLGASYGCHPRFASKCTPFVIETIESFCKDISTFKVKAIGECGLDFYRSTEKMECQVRALKNQVAIAVKYNLPLIIHCRSGSRDAEDPCLNVLASSQLSRFHNIHRHCFNGSWTTAMKWMSYFPNMYFGYTSCCSNFSENSPEMEAFKKIPLDRILLETDAPYFKPKDFPLIRTNISLPGMAISVAEFLAKQRNLPLDHVIEQTTRNFCRMYVYNH